jgi:aminoglycoside phosphotransferase (APT) family kinase protein
MLLTESNIIHYLLSRGLAETSSFVLGNFSCRSGISRHNNFIINKEYETYRYFVKQAFANKEKTGSLKREGYFYEFVFGNEKYQELQKYLPGIKIFDEQNSILVLEYSADYSNLYDWLLNVQHANNPEPVASEVAAALFSLHTISDKATNGLQETGFLNETKPWILNLSEMKMTESANTRSEAEGKSLELIFTMPGFVQMIEDAGKLWEPSGLIHGDCKLNNFLVRQQDNEDKNFKLQLIDWELVNTGDPLWDMATVFQSVLTAWVIKEDPLYKLAAADKEVSIKTLQDFMTTCWKEYAFRFNWDKLTERAMLEKCTAFSALRLIHACFESTPGAKSLRPHSARLLQLSHNIFSDLKGAGEHLLGININR